MSTLSLAQPVKTVSLPRNVTAICPDGCGAELVFLGNARLTTCYCPKCMGGGQVSQCVDLLITWLSRKAAGLEVRH